MISPRTIIPPTFRLFFVLLLIAPQLAFSQSMPIEVVSPNGENTYVLFPDQKAQELVGVPFAVLYKERVVLQPSTLSILSKDIDFGSAFEVLKVSRRNVDSEWTNTLGELRQVPDRYNEITVQLLSGEAKLNLICRAYDEGVAFSYEVPQQGGLDAVSLDDELIRYRFDSDYKVWSTPKRQKGKLTAQGAYRKIPLSELEIGAERPLVVEMGNRCVLALAEAGLVDFARFSFSADNQAEYGILSQLDGKMSRAIQDKVSGALKSQRSTTSKVLSELPLRSPWRVVMLGENHAQLLENNYLILNLNPPCAIADTSWIQPGKALRSALSSVGGKAVIDFVAAHNMQYAHFDAGWYGNEMNDASDATTITVDPKRFDGEFDLKGLIDYAKQKDVKVMLYVNRRALEKQIDELLPLFKQWGVAGIKFGFVRVGDQDATAWMHDAIIKAARYEMIVDVHDEYRPTGFSRTYPNLLTQEGIRGDEETTPNRHTLITMFTRMLAGAADNTVCYYNPRVQEMGSNASQLAKTVCLFSPLQFLYWYDQPLLSYDGVGNLQGNRRNIGVEPELEFFDNVPTTWDETRVLHAEIGEIGVIARRKGEEWFIGAINGETARTVKIDFSFLESQVAVYEAKIYTDDELVKTRTRVKIETIKLNQKSERSLNLKPNNGFAMHLTCLNPND